MVRDERLGPIYGQRSASLAFYKTLIQWLTDEGFKPGHNEPCLFVKEHNSNICENSKLFLNSSLSKDSYLIDKKISGPCNSVMVFLVAPL